MPTSRWSKLRQELSLPDVPNELLQQAFQHGSYVREKGMDPLTSNQRLEFLGDVVLDLIIAEELYRENQEFTEGQLTKRKASTVRAGSLAKVAEKMGLGKYLLLGKGEEDSGGRSKASLLADVLEALVAAVYLAVGLEATREFFLPYFNLDEASGIAAFDHKTALQELLQSRTRQLPTYVTVGMEGPAHKLAFTVEVRFGRKTIGRGVGGSKRKAEQAAAGQALETADEWWPKIASEAS